MNYSLITEQQFQKRVYDLPSILKNALNSESVMGTIGHICQSHYFDNDKTLIIEQLTALVLSGFVAIEDMSKEIAENLEVNKQLADSIYQEIDKKIFPSLKEEIKKIYSPLVAPKSALSWEASKIQAKSATKEDVVDLKTTKPAVGISNETIEITPKETLKQALETQKPEIIPIVNGGEKKPPVVFPKIETDKSSMKLEKPFGEESSFVKTTADEEAPMILHKETELTPLAAEKKSLAEAFTFSSGQTPAARKESSDLAAKISLSPDTEKEKKDKIQMEKPNIRVVHYSDLNTSTSSFGKEPPPVISQSKEINIGFEHKIVNIGGDGKTAQQKEPFDVAQVFDSETQTRGDKFEKIFAPPPSPQTSEIIPTQKVGASTVNVGKEEKKILIPPVEQESFKIDDGEKIGRSTNNEFVSNKRIDEDTFKTSGLSVKEMAERKAFEDAKKQIFKIEQKPAGKSPDELQLKDIPVEEDIIDLRQINE